MNSNPDHVLVHQKEVYSVCVMPNNMHIITGSGDNKARMWNISSGVLEKEFSCEGSVNSVCAMTKNENNFVSGSDDKKARIWDISKSKVIREFSCEDEVSVVCLTSDDTCLVTGSYYEACVWIIFSGERLKTFTCNNFVNSVCLTRKDKYLITGSDDNLVCMWELSSGQKLKQFEGHGNVVNSVYMMQDDIHLVSGSTDGTARVWNISTGNEVKKFNNDNTIVYSVFVSPDNKYLVTGNDEDVFMWNISTGRKDTFNAHSDSVTSVCITPNGKHLVSGSLDKTVCVWDISTDGVLFSGEISLEQRLAQGAANNAIDLTGDSAADSAVDLRGEDETSISGGEEKTSISGGEEKTSSSLLWSYVRPVLGRNQNINDISIDYKTSDIKSYHKSLDKRIQCNIASEARKLSIDIQIVERLRGYQRAQVTAKRSVYLFACIDYKVNYLLSDFNVYIYCAFALQNLGWRHRMVIYDERVTHERLLEEAAKLNYPLNKLFVEQNITCTTFVKNYDKLLTSVKDIEDDEKIALVYLSAHGDEYGNIYGQWDNGDPMPLSENRVSMFGEALAENMTKDCQVFLNSCYAGVSTAVFLMKVLGDNIVLAALDSITTGTVVHRFRIDAVNDRLYFSVNSRESEIKAYSQKFLNKIGDKTSKANSDNNTYTQPRLQQAMSQFNASDTEMSDDGYDEIFEGLLDSSDVDDTDLSDNTEYTFVYNFDTDTENDLRVKLRF